MHPNLRALLVATILSSQLTGCAPDGALPGGKTTQSEDEKSIKTLAENAEKAGDTQAAAEYYRQLAALSTGSVSAHLKAAALFGRMHRYDNALDLLAGAESLKPGDPDILLASGFALTRAGRPEESLIALGKLPENKRNSPNALNGKAVALDYLGRHKEAQAVYQEALKAASGSATLRNNLALSYIFAEQYDEAIRLLQPLAASRNSSPTVRQNLALAYGMKGEKTRALGLLKRDLPEDKAQANLAFYDHYRSSGMGKPDSFMAVPVEPVSATTPEPETPVTEAKPSDERKAESVPDEVETPEEVSAEAPPAEQTPPKTDEATTGEATLPNPFENLTVEHHYPGQKHAAPTP